MAILSVDDFKAQLKGGGARPNLFKVTVNFPAYAGGNATVTSFMVKAAQLPGSTVAPVDVPFRGRILKIAGERTFDPWTITVINDTDFNVRDAMERWSNGINSHSANTGLVSPADYQADMIVEQLDKDETVIKRYDFRGAFPTVVSPIELAYDANDQIEEFTVEFAVQYWESNTTS
jgi:hypothetical protein